MQLDAKWLFNQIMTRDNLFTKGFVTKEFLDLHRVDELKNFTANIFSNLVC